MSRATEAIKTRLQLKQVCTNVCKQGEPGHRRRAAGAVCEGEEVSLQQQSCAPQALSAPRTQHYSSLALITFGKLPRYRRKATASCDTAPHLCVSVPQLQPYLYSQNCSFPLASVQCRFQNNPETMWISATHDKHICHTAAQIGSRNDICPHYASPLLC